VAIQARIIFLHRRVLELGIRDLLLDLFVAGLAQLQRRLLELHRIVGRVNLVALRAITGHRFMDALGRLERLGGLIMA
jgi:hypothetical protein